MTDELICNIGIALVSRVEHCLAACEVISKPLGLGGQEKVDILSF